MMAKGLKIAEPPRRKTEARTEAAEAKSAGQGGEKFSQVAARQKVQFNRRVDQHVADGYDMLAIRTRRRVPELLAEGLALLEEKYGRV